MIQELQEYIEAHSSAPEAWEETIERETYRKVLNPQMLCGHVEGLVLSMLSRMLRPERILELGTYTGYSALCLAQGLRDTPEAELITIDHNDELAEMVQAHLRLHPAGRRVRAIVGDAIEEIRKLGNQEDRKPFDLVFIDADKRQYVAYLEAVLPLCHPGSILLADNTLWYGHITDSAYDRDPQTLGLRAFNQRVANDPRLETVMIPLRDGISLIRLL